ncbi:RNB domain-containing ribonuclease [Phenylobacterium sp. LjRoot164]|uniref:RNB domain-containing ribonuclease n=1 Tax=unclassified Phenylobacterium TaxID=2640670 RepID=UPI003ECCBAA5
MKTLVDPHQALSQSLAEIRTRFKVPAAFPPEVLAAAEAAAQRTPTAHVDRTERRFVTLDPAASTDLDQAFAIEARGGDLILHYAIADVGWFVHDGDPLDVEAWKRGATLYLPDGKASLYPRALSEGAASLLPSGPRPAVVFTVKVAGDGEPTLEGAERALIRSVAKLAYETVTPEELPAGFAELAARIDAAEARRGAVRVDPPEQEVASVDGRLQLRFRPRTRAEEQNAALSLATNLAIAKVMQARKTGLFRVMPEPDTRSVGRLRQTARAFGLSWPQMESLAQFEVRLDPRDPKQAAFMLAVRRAGAPASYVPFSEDEPPWHAAMAAAYAHATAPLRRLADRYVVETVLAIANGGPPPAAAVEAFAKLPKVMARADAQAGQIDRAVIDLAEAVMLQDQVGESFDAVVTDIDERGARMQLCELPVVARVTAHKVEVGERLVVRLENADPKTGATQFQRIA